MAAVVALNEKSGDPIGSKLLTEVLSQLSVSSATLRSEMSTLTNMGYLMQPHTSAGRVPTPQGFRYSELMKCVDYYASEEGTHATDDTLIAERCGLTVKLVEGSYANIKITTPEDVAVAREIVRARWQKQPFED